MHCHGDEEDSTSTQLISLAAARMVGRCRPENDCGEEDEYISGRLRQEETEQQD